MNRKMQRIIKNPLMLFHTFGHRGWFNWMDDKTYLSIAFYIRMGYKLDLDNPKTLNEKLQWLKLYDHRPEYSTMVDKYEAKKFISDIIICPDCSPPKLYPFFSISSKTYLSPILV